MHYSSNGEDSFAKGPPFIVDRLQEGYPPQDSQIHLGRFLLFGVWGKIAAPMTPFSPLSSSDDLWHLQRIPWLSGEIFPYGNTFMSTPYFVRNSKERTVRTLERPLQLCGFYRCVKLADWDSFMFSQLIVIATGRNCCKVSACGCPRLQEFREDNVCLGNEGELSHLWFAHHCWILRFFLYLFLSASFTASLPEHCFSMVHSRLAQLILSAHYIMRSTRSCGDDMKRFTWISADRISDHSIEKPAAALSSLTFNGACFESPPLHWSAKPKVKVFVAFQQYPTYDRTQILTENINTWGISELERFLKYSFCLAMKVWIVPLCCKKYISSIFWTVYFLTIFLRNQENLLCGTYLP